MMMKKKKTGLRNRGLTIKRRRRRKERGKKIRIISIIG